MPGIELNWPNKNRVLYEVPQRGQGKPIYYGDPGTPSWPDHRPLLRVSTHGDPEADPNRLIQGDNLVGLQALLDEGMGRRFKCIYIDPPFNTGRAFTHYDDGYEHTIWLGLMRDRIKMLSKLLAEDGTIWLHLSWQEMAYCRVFCDEIFGRDNFLSLVTWQKKPSATEGDFISDVADYILVYAKNREETRMNLLPRTEEADARYSNPDNDPRGVWTSGAVTISLTSGQRGQQYARTGFSANLYPITTPSGKVVMPTSGTCWRYSETKFAELVADDRIWFGPVGNNVPRLKRFLTEVKQGMIPISLWPRGEVGDNSEAKMEIKRMFSSEADPFPTPKPERLMQRITQIASNPGDWVLDSFAGSGTTAAVAYQMGRRWVTIEMGDHAETHCLPRLEKARLGTAPYKVAAGGGFVFERVGPPLVIHDDDLGIQKMNPEYVNGTYQRAVCLLTGFKHQPDDPVLHGRATADGGRFCHIAERGVLVTDEYLHSIRRTLENLAHANGQDMASCVIYATKTATSGGEGVEVVRIPAGFTSSRKNGKGL